jgi:hypothetical protein
MLCSEKDVTKGLGLKKHLLQLRNIRNFWLNFVVVA